MDIKIKKLVDTAKIPTKQHESDAGYDLYADLHYIDEMYMTINPHQTVKIPTGVAIEIPDGYFGAIFARSGLATNQGLRPANCVGVCDSQYRGEYIVALHNDSEEMQILRHGDRIAQLIILPYLNVNFVEVNDLSTTDRGDNGFGSTGK